MEDQEIVAAVFARRDQVGFTARRTLSIARAAEIERWWAAAPAELLDCRAEIYIVSGPERMLASTSEIVDVDIVNSGNSVWPASDLSRGRLIYLSYHWKNFDGSMAIFEGRRAQLTSRVLPGERVRARLVVNTPTRPGTYRLSVDLVLEHVCWFGIDKEIVVEVETLAAAASRTIQGYPLISIDKAREARSKLRFGDGLLETFASIEPGTLTVSHRTLREKGDALFAFLLAWIKGNGSRRILKIGSDVNTLELAQALSGFARRRVRILSVEDTGEAMLARDKTRHGRLEKDITVLTAGFSEANLCGARTSCYDFTSNASHIREFSPSCVLIVGPPQHSGASRLATVPRLLDLLCHRTPFAMDGALYDSSLEIGDRWQKDPRIEIEGIVGVGRGLLVGHLRGEPSNTAE